MSAVVLAYYADEAETDRILTMIDESHSNLGSSADSVCCFVRFT